MIRSIKGVIAVLLLFFLTENSYSQEVKDPSFLLVQKPVQYAKTIIGKATYYSNYFHGRQTANGDVFDQDSFTAAHRELPLPSVVRVTNLENNRSVVVVITDRGPYAKKSEQLDQSKVLDLSRKAAHKIGMIQKGVVHVKIDYLPLATKKLLSRAPIYKKTRNYRAFHNMIKSFAEDQNRNA